MRNNWISKHRKAKYSSSTYLLSLRPQMIKTECIQWQSLQYLSLHLMTILCLLLQPKLMYCRTLVHARESLVGEKAKYWDWQTLALMSGAMIAGSPSLWMSLTQESIVLWLNLMLAYFSYRQTRKLMKSLSMAIKRAISTMCSQLNMMWCLKFSSSLDSLVSQWILRSQLNLLILPNLSMWALKTLIWSLLLMRDKK